MIYGNGIDKLKLETHTFQTPSNKKIEMSTVSSSYHMEANPSDAGIYDRIVIQELIKRLASTNQIDRSQQKDFKVVVLHEVDRLSREAQHALRRTMEKYISSCRLILCAETTSRIIPATKSRCLSIRVRAPTIDEMCKILMKVTKKEGLDMPVELATRIANASNRNLRRALLMAEVAKVDSTPLRNDQPIKQLDWQRYINETARAIIQEQSTRSIKDIRNRLYDLLSHCIPPDVILKGLVDTLFESCDSTVTPELIKLAANCDHRMQLGSKAIFHLESFVISFMATYKRYMEDAFVDEDF